MSQSGSQFLGEMIIKASGTPEELTAEKILALH
jgi:hypothetical protein